VVADDVTTDLVLLSVERGNTKTTQIALNVSFVEPLEGEDVFVVSSPSGLKGVISTGIISAIHNEYDIQISCPISTGSSGAPIFNFKGEVVGVVVGHFTTGQQLNFGISVQGLTNLIKQLEKNAIPKTLDPSDDNIKQVITSSPLLLPAPDSSRIPPTPTSTLQDNLLFPSIREWLETNMPQENTTTSLIPFSLVDLWSGLKNLTKGILNWELLEKVKREQRSKL